MIRASGMLTLSEGESRGEGVSMKAMARVLIMSRNG